MLTHPLLALLAGLVSTLGWSPWGWWYLPLLSFACLYFWLNTSPSGMWRSCIYGLLFGVGLHWAGHGWIFSVLHEKTGLDWFAAGLSTLAFMLYNSLFIALPCAIFSWLSTQFLPPHHAALRALFFATLLALGEYMRSLFFNGFTSLSLGFSLVNTWFAGYAPLGGVYLVSFVGFLTSATTACIALQRHFFVRALCIISTLLCTGWLLSFVPWVKPHGGKLTFRLLQENVPQEQKFHPDFALRHSTQLQRVVTAQPADLIITPETAFPQLLHQLPAPLLADLQAFSTATNSHMLLGMATANANSDGYNTVLHIGPHMGGMFDAASSWEIYKKVHLMPFGEYSPFGFAWFTHSLSIPLKDLSSGDANQPPFTIKDQRIGTLICHEDFVGSNGRYWVTHPREATMIINPSNLAWFEKSLAIEQRIQIVQMLALAIGRPVLRVANTGVTAHINHQGLVISRLPAETLGELNGSVQGFSGKTPYAQWGESWFFMLGFINLTALLKAQRTRNIARRLST